MLEPPADFDGSPDSWLASAPERQRALFDYAHAEARGRQTEIPAKLSMLRARAELTALPVAERHAVLTGPGGLRPTAGIASYGHRSLPCVYA
ncbi:hypothetical protein AB0B39_12290 [Micromonospora sp. NPDC049114]|uniref:hypothetical protein n=1 Tax=unclassified Micromonospora TaxID=2617518 RepID=UPI0033E6D6AE